MPLPVTFTEWRRLRKALGLSQSEFARALSMSDAGYGQVEREGRKVQQARITILRVLLQEPEVVERLERAGFQHPFPLDLVRMSIGVGQHDSAQR